MSHACHTTSHEAVCDACRVTRDEDMAALCALLEDEGIHAVVLSPARPIIMQGTLADGTRFDLRAFGDRVSLRTWPAGIPWQRTIHDGDGTQRTVPDIRTADYHGVIDGWRWGEAATLDGDDLQVALLSLLAERTGS